MKLAQSEKLEQQCEWSIWLEALRKEFNSLMVTNDLFDRMKNEDNLVQMHNNMSN